MRKCELSVYFTIGDVGYEVAVTSYTLGTPATLEDPGDGPEVELSDRVDVEGGGHVTLDQFYALLGPTPEAAENVVIEKAIEVVYESLE